MNSYQIGLLLCIAMTVIATIIAAVRSENGRKEIIAFSTMICVALFGLVQMDKIAVKAVDTETKVDTAIVKQGKIEAKVDTAAEKAETAAEKVEEVAATAAETKSTTVNSLLKIEKATEAIKKKLD